MRDLYEHLAPLNQTVVGGGAYSVGVGGYLTGGGHSILSARYGLAADQVLEIELVTPQGRILVANECQNKDLFWAMRGVRLPPIRVLARTNTKQGGGSTFGVLTSVTLKTYPSPSMLHNDFFLAAAVNEPRIWDAIAYIYSQFPALAKQGLSAYTFVVPVYPNPLGSDPPYVSGMFGRAVLQDTADAARMDGLFAPILAHINATWPGAVNYTSIVTHYPSFLDWYRVNYDDGTAGADAMLASRLLDERALTANVTALRHAVYTASLNPGGLQAHLVSGPGVHDAKPRGGSDAVGPAWRTAYLHTSEFSASTLDTERLG